MKYIPYGHQKIDLHDMEDVVSVLKSDWITQGPKITAFEDALCKYSGAKYAVAVSSGTAALHIACLAARIGQGDEVITSPLTFLASANCVLYCGARPVFVDIEKNTANIDTDGIEEKINKKTKAIIPIHFAGHPADLEEIFRVTKRHNLIIIEDAAHALGAEYKNTKIGCCKYSDMTTLSFHPVKSITTGEGGAVLTNRKDLYDNLSMLRNHGITKDDSRFTNNDSQSIGDWYYEMQYLGYNYRLTDIQCALGISQLKKLKEFIERRRKIVEIYNNAFKDNSFFDLPPEKKGAKSSRHLYPIRLKDGYKDRKKLIFDRLKEKGLGVQVHYLPVYLQPYYQKLGYEKGLCPKAEDFYQREISIPLYPSMANEDVRYVIEKIFECFREIK